MSLHTITPATFGCISFAFKGLFHVPFRAAFQIELPVSRQATPLPLPRLLIDIE